MNRLIRRVLPVWTAVTLVACAAAPVWAQAEGETKGKSMTFFDQFFWSDDVMGCIFIWLLVLMSMANIALVILFLVKTTRSHYLAPEVVEDYDVLLEEKRYKEAIEQSQEDDTPFGEVLHASLKEASNGWAHMQRSLEETVDLVTAKRHRKVEILNIFGATGPMIGLFGTVYGMIIAFGEIVKKGGQPNPADLAGGISTALVTTLWGLIVGIPAVAAASVVKNKIDELMVDVAVTAEDMIRQFKPKRDKDRDKAKRPGTPGAKPIPATPKPRPA